MQILEPRTFYKPLEYPWAYELWKQHESMHWLGHEVPLADDVRDWNDKLNADEKSLLTHLFRFFTQADIDVANGYNGRFLPYFSHKPELGMMMGSFAAREAIHIDAYALLLETVGMPETTYQQFQEYKEMVDKHEYVSNFNMDTHLDVLKTLAVYSAFTEGVQLFGSFAILLNFPRMNKMNNMGNIINWSIRDESLHVEGMTQVFREYFKDIKKQIAFNEKDFINEIRVIGMEMVDLEDKFVDLVFSDSAGAVEGLTADEVKGFIRFIANLRWEQLGFEGVLYEEFTKNPLPWVEEMVNGEEHTNFFEAKSTQYSKAMTEGSMEDIQW